MTDKKISELSAAAALAGTEMVELVQNSVNVRSTVQAVANLLGTQAMVAYKYSYSFGVDGGATGTLTMRSTSGAVPAGFIPVQSFVDVQTILGSGGLATVGLVLNGLGLQLVDDLTAFSALPWSVAIVSDCVTSKRRLTVAATPQMLIHVAALNAGIFNLYILGVQS